MASSAAWPLVRALAACFEADPLIDEYDFVPLLPPPATEDPAPAAAASSFLVEHHKLAISAAAVKPLFREAHAAFQAAAAGAEVVDATRALLLVNPDVYTAWNARKRLVVAGGITETAELAFVDLVFSKHTKKACAWAHRRWCLARLWRSSASASASYGVESQEAHELEVTAAIAERLPKNYYAWTHRWWVVEAGVARRGGRWARDGSVTRWLDAQVAFGAAWVERHAWDMSAVSFLHQALRAWAEVEEEDRDVLLARLHHDLRNEFGPPGTLEYDEYRCMQLWLEMEEKNRYSVVRLRELLVAGARKLDQCPGHESLWYQRRGLVALWVQQQHQLRASKGEGVMLALLPPQPPEPSSNGLAAPYPWPLNVEDSKGDLLAWELGMAAYYQQGQGPFHTEDSAGLLWEEAARRRQRVCAWAHARWIVGLLVRRGVGGLDCQAEWARCLSDGLGALRGAAAEEVPRVPPGYGKLVAQLGEDKSS